MDISTLLILAVFIIAMVVILGKLKNHTSRDQNKKRVYKNNNQPAPEQNGKYNSQLQEAVRGGYRTQKLLNNQEKIIYYLIQKIIHDKHIYCFPQVSCGEIFAHENNKIYLQTINSKRVDFCLTDRNFNPVAVVEYQGTGHKSGDSGYRDAVKSMVATGAGILFIQVFYGESYQEKLTTSLEPILSH